MTDVVDRELKITDAMIEAGQKALPPHGFLQAEYVEAMFRAMFRAMFAAMSLEEDDHD